MADAEEILLRQGFTPEQVQALVDEPPVVDHRLRETGNGPEVNYEEALLCEYFGEPDADGVYGKGGDDVG